MRIEGGADFLEVSRFTNRFLRFESLGVRHITNATEASFRPVKQLSLYGAYRFSTRRVSTRDAIEFPDFGFENELVAVDNDVHAGAAGLRWLPAKGVRVSFDFEAGRADQPLTPVSEKRFHNERFRVQWRKKGFAAAAYFSNEINSNPAELVDYSSDGRSGGFQLSWADPDARWTLDGGYAWIHLDTAAGIFNLFEPGQAARTFYTSNLHTANFGARLALHQRATLYLGYSLAKDTGDGRDRLSVAEGVEASLPELRLRRREFLCGFSADLPDAPRPTLNRRDRESVLEPRLAALQLRRTFHGRPRLPRPRRLFELPLVVLTNVRPPTSRRRGSIRLTSSSTPSAS